MLQLQLMDYIEPQRAEKVRKKFLKFIASHNKQKHVNKVPTGLDASVKLYDKQQQVETLYNPASFPF